MPIKRIFSSQILKKKVYFASLIIFMDFLNWFRGKKKKKFNISAIKKKGFKNKKCIISFLNLKCIIFKHLDLKEKHFKV